jgi:hypothetical protein
MRPSSLADWIARITPVLALVLIALIALPAEAQKKRAVGSGDPFDRLKGYWTGGGVVTPLKGNPEKVSCRATYTGAGSTVSQSLRCPAAILNSPPTSS